ncbi:NFACT RNA binding domain-containing protein [Lentilactobacillus sp. Marseille-Q4993]|uniref:NFACT RNA binding domain-containing protein n=1 Tax=Lentilactobacillus sp. Marseille-Q4993 TaxID=3039492 RepID=UPI0024BD1F2C|nr:NFACT RNA binding domain-containing protein [Lentilactobacillus sp. Marseille-Q4993]
MSFDGSFTHAMKKELNNLLATGRVSKINQPYPNELLVTIRANGKNRTVLLSANPNYARTQITTIPAANPAVPNNFTMVMRKYLSGSILEQVTQLDNDRVLKFHFTGRNELGDQTKLLLIVEIMARHSNVILVDDANSKVIDAIKHVGSDVNRYRTILPGSTYINPPKQDLLDPFEFDDFDKLTDLMRQFPNQDVLAENLRKTFQGLGNDTSLALAISLHQSNDIKNTFTEFFAKFSDPKPSLGELANGKPNFSAFAYPQIKNNREFDTLSELLDVFYEEKAQKDRVHEQGSVLINVVKKQLKKNRTKLKRLKKDMAETDHADEFRIKGEVLTTYLSQVNRGDTSVTLPNFYEENAPIKISLSNEISPSANAQKYFKKYQKLKNAVSYLNDQISTTEAEISYFESIESQIELANPEDLRDIRLELEQGNYLKNHEQHQKKNKRKQKINKPEVFTASDGTEILVGKNNLQNEKLTMHTADKREYWLHTKDIPGSHVIVRSYEPSEETLLEAANLAAYFSKARDSTKVPVDYTQVRHIRKPNGTKPGYVIYDSQTTVLVDPDEAAVKKLQSKR